jgi:hypothetical protein
MVSERMMPFFISKLKRQSSLSDGVLMLSHAIFRRTAWGMTASYTGGSAGVNWLDALVLSRMKPDSSQMRMSPPWPRRPT